MEKLFFRLFLVLFLVIWTFIYTFPFSYFGLNVPFSWSNYRLWLDLQWWVELDYKVDLDEVSKQDWYNLQKENSIIEWLKSIIDKRIEALNINDSVISTATYWQEKHIIVQIPLKWSSKEQDELNIKRAKEAIWRVMKIEFKELRTNITEEDYKKREEIAFNALDEAKNSKYNFSVTQYKYKDNYENITLWEYIWNIDDLKNYINFEKEKIKPWIYDSVLYWTWFQFIENKLVDVGDSGYFVIDIKNFDWDKIDFEYIFVWKTPSDWVRATDSKWRVLNEDFFVNSSVQYDQAFNPMVELVFNNEWAKIFWELTTRLKWKQIAIFVWWNMLTAPVVNEPILDWKAVITWNFTPKEAKKLSDDINTWVVPAPIYLTSERAIDSKLWNNSLTLLIKSWIVWFILIFLFLIFVYRLSWFLAWIALFIYVILVLALVKMFWLVLTLASIAWLILSIGIAIDANILIFERIKEELRQKKDLQKAIKKWFETSWTAIWDSNITGLIISVILFVFWVNMIKWFGLMLGIWIVVSLFSAMFISRLFILLLSYKKWITNKSFIWLK